MGSSLGVPGKSRASRPHCRNFLCDFLMDNLDLVGQVEAGFREGIGGSGLPVLLELEQRAQRFPR
jgi:hypothetical protein